MLMPFAEKALGILEEIAHNKNNLQELDRWLLQIVPFVGAGLSIDFGYPLWEQFLREAAAQFNLCPTVEPYLAKQQFEEAAESFEPKPFDGFLRRRFDEAQLKRPLHNPAVLHLTHFAQGLVLTTNFDHVLESVFRGADQPFHQIIVGTNIREISRAVELRQQNALLKLHGDYNDTDSRIITRANYKEAYGSDDPRTINLSKPLPSILGQILGAFPLLFLGCSLKADRTTQIIARIARERPRTMHFALLPLAPSEIDKPDGRLKELYGWNIWPIFFAEGRFAKV